ncbi:HlyD family secretion protein [Paraburkholderia sp. UYCP14C]|uniref:HlyD family secretion protein n=1 Tax=Paraburkholderia sp. UYCP14C TaxID=2511130 RepID=UPI0010213AEE|nr:HlyD family secretion protein [Paraburkholderia sp. UYCP14C]RZF30388.1 HlyD family secretion protein [Paraburkholderia sp. UYCP14C]
MAENQAPAALALPSSAPAERRTSRKKRWIIVTILVCASLVAGRMWWHSRYYEETENAYLDGDVTLVSPRVAGTVRAVFVRDNQRVKGGDLLLELDGADYEIKVQHVLAELGEIDAHVKQVDAQVQQSAAESAAADAQVSRAEVQARHSRADALRYASVYAEDMKAVSKQELDNAIAASEMAASELQAQKDQASAAQAKQASLAASRSTLLAHRDVLLADLQEARQNLDYNRIYAPVSGRIGKKNVEVGSRIQPGEQVLAIVQDSVWVNANFKETQLAGLAQGQLVQVRIDAVPGHTFVGRIDSFSPASGAHFALLPPDNATGNFTKIVQRVPVKIVLEPGSVGAFKDRLMPGMSALVEIDLRQVQGGSDVKTAESAAERQTPRARSRGNALTQSAALPVATTSAPLTALSAETADEMQKRIVESGWDQPASAAAVRVAAPARHAAQPPIQRHDYIRVDAPAVEHPLRRGGP